MILLEFHKIEKDEFIRSFYLCTTGQVVFFFLEYVWPRDSQAKHMFLNKIVESVPFGSAFEKNKGLKM